MTEQIVVRESGVAVIDGAGKVWCEAQNAGETCELSLFLENIPAAYYEGFRNTSFVFRRAVDCESAEDAEQCKQSLAKLIYYAYRREINCPFPLDFADLMHIFEKNHTRYLHVRGSISDIDAACRGLSDRLSGADMCFVYLRANRSHERLMGLMEFMLPSLLPMDGAELWQEVSTDTDLFDGTYSLDVWHR